MSKEQATGRGGWRGEKPRSSAPTRRETLTKKWVGAAALSLLLLSVAGVLVWLSLLFLFPYQPQPTFVPLLVSDYQRPQIAPIAELQNERAAIQKAQVFPIVDTTEDPYGDPTLDVMKTRLKNLAPRKPGKGLVVYLAAYAMVSGAGDVQILAHDSDPYSPATLLPLRTLLTLLKAAPERRKLLVLDIMRPAPRPFDLGGTPDGVADLIRKELRDEKDSDKLVDPDLMVLVACSPGQTGLWSEGLHETVFGHYFRAAFADSAADSISHNGSVSVKELAAYLAQKVDQWAVRYRGVRQVPYLDGGANDFDLALVKPDAPKSEPKPEPKVRPAAETKEAEEQARKETAAKKGDEAKKEPPAAEESSKKSGAKPASDSDSTPEQSDYPDWLAAGWQVRQDWWKDAGDREFQGAQSPRVFRKLEVSLLRAEREWRGGGDAQGVGGALTAAVKGLQEQMAADSKIPRPRAARSVGQAKAFGWQAENALVSKLRNLIETQRAAPPASDPKAVDPARKKAVDELLAAVKSKSNPALELAGTIVDAADAQRLDPGTINFLDGLVAESKLERNVVELRVLHDLAERAANPGPQGWSEEIVKTAWDMIGLAEKAASRPRAFAWVRSVLDKAQNERHAAQVLLLSQTRGFVSWDQIRNACEPAVRELNFILGFQDKIEDAQTVLNRARACLPAYLAYLRATQRLDLDSAWQTATDAAVALDRRLQKPPVRENAAPGLSHDELEQLSGELNEALATVRSALRQLERPFQAEAVKDLTRRMGSSPEPRLAAEIEAMLTTPYLDVKDRAALWKAGRELERRLGELPVRDENPAAEPRRADAARNQVSRRAKRLEALLRLTGAEEMASNLGGAVELTNAVNALDPITGKSDEAQASALAQDWAGLAKVAGLVYNRLIHLLDQRGKASGDDRIGWVASPFLLNVAAGSTKPARERDALENWSWLAARYRQQARDLREAVQPEEFYEDAALDCPTGGTVPSQPYLALTLNDASIPTLSASQPEAVVSVKIDAGASLSDHSQKVRLKSIQIDDPRLRVELGDPQVVELSPQNPTVVAPIKVEWDEDRGRSDSDPPKGFMVEARLPDDRTFHLLVPVRFEWRAVFPKLALSGTKDKLTEVPIDRFSLRTLPSRQPFYVFLINPSPTAAREVIVEVMAGDKVIASSGEKPLPLPQKTTISVPAFSASSPGEGQLPKEGLPLADAPADLKIRLRDAKPPGQEFAVLNLRPAIAAPREYVQVTRAQFQPVGPDGGQNQLRVDLRALPRMTGPPCPVELVFPRDRELFPSFQGAPQGKLSGAVEIEKDLTLTADGIRLGLGGTESGIFQLNIDGIQRAIWFRANFPQVGGVQVATEETTPPRVRFTTERIVKPDQPAQLRIHFQVDKVPPQATLAFNLGREVDGKFKPDIQFAGRPPRKRHIGFSPLGAEGALLFEAAVTDWDDTYPVAGIRGTRWAQAFLLGSRPEPLAESGTVKIVLDDEPPRVEGIALPAQIDEGTPAIDVNCTLIPSTSRVTSVDFMTGTKPAADADFTKADDEGKLIKGKMVQENDQRIWNARLPVPKDATGKLVVTVRATNEVGLSGVLSQALTIREKPAPVSPEEAAAKMAPKPGSIQGTVVESTVARAGFTVYLIDPKEKDPEKGVKDTQTNEDGAFAFEDVKPGNYTLYCQNPETKRLARPSVTVEAGKTLRVKLDLLLP